MQVTETLSEGLTKQFTVSIPAGELEDALSGKIEELKGKVQLKGFRPGKVPAAHIRKVYGKSIMGELVEEKIQASCDDVIKDNDLKVAVQPKVDFGEEQQVVADVIDGKADLDFKVNLELLPEFTLMDLKTLKLERPIAKVTDSELKEALDTIIERSKPFEKAADSAKAGKGDQVHGSFVGKLDGEPFEGGTSEHSVIQIGSGQYVPGFEDALIGAKAGKDTTFEITMPEDYQAENLAGKTVEFTVSVKEIHKPGKAKSLEEVAKDMGMEDEAKLREAVTGQIENEFGTHTREKIKRALLDALDEAHQFEVPPSMLEQEFEQIWQSVVQDQAQTGKTFEDDDTTEETAREDYRKIASRRVRLGLVLTEIGQQNDIKLSEEESNRAVYEYVMRFPGEQQQVLEFLQKNQQAVSQVTAPALEDKVVDFILELADVTDKTVSKEKLFEPIEA